MLVVAVLVSRGGDKAADTSASARATTTVAVKTTAPKPGAPATANPGRADQSSTAAPSRAPGVPDRAYATLTEIDAGRWPDSANAPGTQGGETWNNRERRLPATDSAGQRITYQEWDVNPKKRGQTRDAERIVTGSDGTAWYTGDHYKTFTRMR
ncbi:ribonuclease [Nocardia sp. 2]|uniref:Ribonuclease n=1 Tax=Nocardia acididurans TaxID=2802282 RepID=A0ABS1M3B8_9NOCA|nr:ribonuclease domain-containing protein [Nocardia acididurans]MBL1075031.1 ribonuclease [Nocardia acididurans]